MALLLPSTVHDRATQECLDAIARQFPIQGGNLAKLKVRDDELAEPVIAGVVKANGEKEAGEGFSCKKTAEGIYEITLSTELATVGAIAVCPVSGSEGFLPAVSGPSQKAFTVEWFNTSLAKKNSNFHFMIKAT